MVKLLLYPFSVLYGIVVYIRNRLYDYKIIKSTEFSLPVISIGNITVGGTGKTPHTEYLANLLKDKYQVAALSRGYKRKSKGFRIVEVGLTSKETGDEPLQIKTKFPEIIVAVCKNRVTAIKNLLASGHDRSPDVILLDDAFQHRKITPGINILLINYNKQLKNDLLLPAGRLREKKSEIHRADIIIISKCPHEINPITKRTIQKNIKLKPYQSLFFSTFEYGNLIPVFPENNENNLSDSDNITVFLVTGIASSKELKNHINKTYKLIYELKFKDHHYYSNSDIHLILDKFNSIHSENKLIVTTEKDAVRFKDLRSLPNQFKSKLYYQPVKVKFLDNEGTIFNQKIINYVGEN